MLFNPARHIIGEADVKSSFAILEDVDAISCRHPAREIWLRGLDLNQRPSGYEPDELPGCSTPRVENRFDVDAAQIKKRLFAWNLSGKCNRVCFRRRCDFVDV